MSFVGGFLTGFVFAVLLIVALRKLEEGGPGDGGPGGTD